MELYPRPVHDAYRRRTLRYSEAVDRACEAIRRATDGLGTDEATLIRELTPLSPHDRALVVFRYKDLYREQVKDTLRRELAGDYRVLLLLMIMSPPEADAFLLHMAATRWRTKEKFISTVRCSERRMTPRPLYSRLCGGRCKQILLGRTNEELSILRATYADLFNQDLTRMMKEELSGDLRTIAVLALEVQQQASIASGYSELTCNVGYDPVSQRLQEDFDPAVHTIERAQEDADALYKAGEGRWGTDEDTFIKILFRSPREHLVQLNDVYRKKYRSDLEAAVRCEFSGYATEALLHYGASARSDNPADRRLIPCPWL